jgi:hypothetical protein
MKNIKIKHISLWLVMLLAIIGCEDREIINIDDQTSPVAMGLSAQNLILDSNFPANPALTITWKSAAYTVPVEVRYDVEISSKESFADAVVLASTTQSQTNASFTTKQLNDAAKKIGLVPSVAQKMYFRVTSYLGDNNLPQASNITPLTITPYLARPIYNYTDIYLIGDATMGGWDNLATNENLLPMLKTAKAGEYTFTGLFKVGGFKMIKVRGSWDAQYGLGTTAGQLSTDGGSGDIKITTEGYYKLSINTVDLTYSIVSVTNPVTTYANLSIIGTSTGGTDIQLTKSTFDPHFWTIKKVSLKEGVFKFRANNAWDVNWGTNSEFFGVGANGGADIPLLAEWTYDIYFNDISGNYTLIPTE